MALTINTNIRNDADGYSLDAQQVKGGFISVNTIEERNAIPPATKVAGSLCYVKDDKVYEWNGTSWEPSIKVYSKPSTGIPKSDLSATVQSSLNKADTALQSNDLDDLNTRVEVIEGKEAGWDAKLDDAPTDGKQYARKNGTWAEVEDGITDFDDLTNRPKYNGSQMSSSTNIPEVKTDDWDGAVEALGGHTVAKDVPADAVFTDTVYDDTAITGRVETVEGNITNIESRLETDEQNITDIQTDLGNKQDKLTPGNRITIQNNVISAESCLPPFPDFNPDKQYLLSASPNYEGTGYSLIWVEYTPGGGSSSPLVGTGTVGSMIIQ